MGIFEWLFGNPATPLHRAAGTGDHQEVARLLAGGADVNARNCCGDTPLIWAARGAHIEVAKLLLSKGADVDMPGSYGMTPFYHAVVCCRFVGLKHTGHLVIAKMLLSAGADINVRSADGETPLEWAMKENQKQMVEFLREASAIDYTVRDARETPARHEFAQSPVTPPGARSRTTRQQHMSQEMKCPKCGGRNDESSEIRYPWNKLPAEVQEVIKRATEQGMSHRLMQCPRCDTQYVFVK